jgi:NitT/TauT family transport system substrate-binding protein
MILQRFRLPAGLTGLMLLLLAACDSPTAPLRVGTNRWAGYEPLYLARSLGWFDENTVRLVEYPSTSEVTQALRNHFIEAAALTLDETLLAMRDNIPLQVVLVMDISHGADAVLAKPEIHSVADLRGKRIGVENTAVGGLMLEYMLAHARLSPLDIEPVAVTADQHARLFNSGEVDAIVTFEPIRGQLLAQGARVIFDSSQIPGQIMDVLVARSDQLEGREDQARRLLQAWFKAVDYMQKQPEDAARRMAPRMHLEPAAVMANFTGLRLPDLAENHRVLGGARPELRPLAANLMEFMRLQKVIAAPLDLAPLPNPRYLPEATP